MELEDQFRILVGGYYGVRLMDEYPLKEFVMEDIKNYIETFNEINPIPNFDYDKEWERIQDTVSERVKLQDSLLVLNKINGSMDLVFLIKKRLKSLEKK